MLVLTASQLLPFRSYHYNSSNEKESVALGDTQIKLKEFAGSQAAAGESSSGDEVSKVLKIVNPKNGKPSGEVRTGRMREIV